MEISQSAAVFTHGACAVGYAALAVLILVRGPVGRTSLLLTLAALATGGWAAAVALSGAVASLQTAALPELLSRLAWFGVLLHILRRGPAESWQIGRVLGGIAVLIGLLMFVDFGSVGAPPGAPIASGMILLIGRLLFAVCSVLLLENVYYNTSADGRWHLNLLCVALAGLFLYDIVLYSDAVLFHRLSATLFASRSVAALIVVPLLTLSVLRNRRWKFGLQVSRDVAFHSASLVLSGLFLMAVAATAAVFRSTIAGGWGSVAEISLLFGAATLVAVMVTSGTARSRLRGMIATHFFRSRYDYRQEWMRCNAVLSGSDAAGAAAPMQARMIRAIAELVDSPAGALFVREPDAFAMSWAGSWNMPAATALDARSRVIAAVGDRGGAVDMTADPDLLAEPALREMNRPWLAVPLRHNAELVGLVVVTRPRSPFTLDAEAEALLTVVGQAVGSRIAEQIALRRLSETRQFADYNRRFAFVVHDIKNVAGQLSMVLANAAVHRDNPEFQADVLETVRASADRIGAMLRKIAEREPDAPGPQQAAQAPKSPAASAGAGRLIEPSERIVELLAGRRSTGAAPVFADAPARHAVTMDAEAFDAVIAHLLDNAEQANARAGQPHPVRIAVRDEGAMVAVTIADDGDGMTPEFIRDQLFKPFETTRRGGHGIGAYQARALLREAGGDLIVRSGQGAGTEMRLLLPALTLPATSALEPPVADRPPATPVVVAALDFRADLGPGLAAGAA